MSRQDQPVYLVSCVSVKTAGRCPAAELYQSDWFRKTRAYVEATGCRWFILSAEHGLLHPSDWIDPYNTTLLAMGAYGRRQWGKHVVTQLSLVLGQEFNRDIVFLAGKHYRAPLLDFAGHRARIPMEGLGIGQQKSWLARQAGL